MNKVEDIRNIYEKFFGDSDKSEEDKKQEGIQKHCFNLSKEMLEWQRQEFNTWGDPWCAITHSECNDLYTAIDLASDFRL